MNIKGANRGIKRETFKVVMAVASLPQPFSVRDLYDAAPVERPTVTKALGWMVHRRWVGPPDGKRRRASDYKREYKYARTRKFPKDATSLKMFKPKPRPRASRPLFNPTEMDRAWADLKATFRRPIATIDELLPDAEVRP